MTNQTHARAIFIGRQPVFNRDLELYGYELLFHGSGQGHENMQDAGPASAQVIVNAFAEFGLERVFGDSHAFINMPRDFIDDNNQLSLQPGQVVLEVLESIGIDEQLVHGVRTLSGKGFTIALDDFIYSPKWEPLLELAAIVKIGVPDLSDEELWNHAVKLRKYNVRLLAEKVETEEEYELLRNMGYDMFQGCFIARPKFQRASRIPTKKLTILRLLIALHSEETDLDRLEQIVFRDKTMSRHILHYINTAYDALARKVESIHEGIVYAGTKNIRRWATLIAMSGIDDRPAELLTMAMMRACMCEQLAEKTGHADTDGYFTVGLFSVLDALLRLPMERVAGALPVSTDMKAALLDRQGKLGEALSCTLACEQGEIEQASFDSLDKVQLRDIYIESMIWSSENTRLLLH